MHRIFTHFPLQRLPNFISIFTNRFAVFTMETFALKYFVQNYFNLWYIVDFKNLFIKIYTVH